MPHRAIVSSPKLKRSAASSMEVNVSSGDSHQLQPPLRFNISLNSDGKGAGLSSTRVADEFLACKRLKSIWPRSSPSSLLSSTRSVLAFKRIIGSLPCSSSSSSSSVSNSNSCMTIENVAMKTLPESTSAACFWCAGTFDGCPVVLPTQEESGLYTVYGNFCTLSCSLSYLLHELVDPQVRWERQALLHRMYKQTEPIQPAPPKESLAFFGGELSYQQYRDVIEKKQIRIDAQLPPVISILATLDTKPIDFYETSLRNTTTTGTTSHHHHDSTTTIKHLDTGLRLKRSKSLKDKESTLDAVMNLNVRVKN